jgi:hypothetical protein
MAGTWALARAAFATKLQGQTATPTGHAAQTLTCTQWPPNSRQNTFPHGYVIPPELEVIRFPGAWRAFGGEIRVRIVLGQSTQMADVTQMYDAWTLAVTDAFDENLTLDGACDYIGAQSNGPLTHFDEDDAWGFETKFENFRVSAAETYAG